MADTKNKNGVFLSGMFLSVAVNLAKDTAMAGHAQPPRVTFSADTKNKNGVFPVRHSDSEGGVSGMFLSVAVNLAKDTAMGDHAQPPPAVVSVPVGSSFSMSLQSFVLNEKIKTAFQTATTSTGNFSMSRKITEHVLTGICNSKPMILKT